MQQLKIGSSLQGGKYKIEKVLGQGGFGITYLATQELLDRKVCIKEFFFKEYCERDEATSHVSLGAQSNHELVERFMTKFLKEARTISQLEHPHIIRIHDIFKENNTAYYVMEYIEGESLADRVNHYGCLPESEAVDYIKQVASALDFIHQRSINHLDVKPANIMIRKSDNKAVLIDFGLSKQYDAQGGQTSTTPVGISHGYAPMEQYNVGGVSTFSPQTDIYSLGATLYKLVTGNTPPQASDVLNDGLPELPLALSSSVKNAIIQAMQVRKKDRPEDVKEFLDLMNTTVSTASNEETKNVQPQLKQVEDESTMILDKLEAKEKVTQSRYVDNKPKPTISFEPEEKEGETKNTVGYLLIMVLSFFILLFMLKDCSESNTKVTNNNQEQMYTDTIKIEERPVNMYNNHKYVDLGLSIKWAVTNVNANNSTSSGDFYSWSEIYDLNNNVVTNQWGEGWRLPTRDEFQELIEGCDWTYDSMENGFWAEGKNGNKIFLPAGGHKYNDNLSLGGASYWTSTLYEQYSNGAFSVTIDEDYNYDWEAYKANFKFLVRPVLDNNAK